MERFFYEEKQRLPAILTWSVVLVGLGMIGGVSMLIYNEVVLGQDTGIHVKKLTIVVIAFLIILTLIAWLTYSFYLEVRIGPSGIDYRYFPYHHKSRHVATAAVTSYSIRDVKLKDYFHSSLDRKLGSGTTGEVFMVTGSTVVEIQLHGGQRVVLGTQNKESIAWAMKKLIENRS